ncbi:ATP-binding protein [Anaerosalibacter massiliensis]|uniref:ATP-binding protein n=1 Tax=Anaerosalibacter massiliensis TaxID=1347392 RepID=A0A9X2S4B3_9FIRM|nr:ATP-binding protein [Anaerosalibacter massiliensis]MCR2043303.1 ATP-binding protein [Anaerosalibacter massiliensis]
MNIAVLSGKGGTGKTTVSTNLSLALKGNYIDCDVEEPNGFLFLKPNINEVQKVLVDCPDIDEDKCMSCGDCVNICQFNALAKVKDNIILFEKLCHSCGACKIACDYEALNYKKREIGAIEKGQSKEINCMRGLLNVGEPTAVPIIKTLLNNLPKGLNIVDCPPGTSCNVVNSLRYADSAILVTEPTEFGLHDLKMAIGVVRMFNIPFGIVINKDNNRDNRIRKYCKEENIKIIGAIPYSKDIARIYSNGENIYYNLEQKHIFDKLAEEVKRMIVWS